MIIAAIRELMVFPYTHSYNKNTFRVKDLDKVFVSCNGVALSVLTNFS